MTNPLPLALPAGQKSTADAQRYLAEAFARVLESASDITSEDWSGTPYNAVILGDAIFEYDSTDTTTAHDGTTCLVDTSGRRYKLQERVFVKAKVDDKDTTAQPGSPSIGDAYLLPAAPTGADWSSKAKNIAQYTARGWIFKAPEEGDIVYVKDESAFYHYPSSGTWTLGLGSLGLADDSVGIAKLIHKFGFQVEAEQNAPPGSVPAANTAYIVGTSPTGDWSSNAADIAVSNGTAWDFITPEEGAVVYDRGTGVIRAFVSGSWQSGAGNSVQPIYIQPVETGLSHVSGETVLLSFTINSVGNDLVRIDIRRLFFLLRWTTAGIGQSAVQKLRLYRDSEADSVLLLQDSTGTPTTQRVKDSHWAGFQSASSWLQEITTSPDGDIDGDVTFGGTILYDYLNDTAEHTYKVAYEGASANRIYFGIYAVVEHLKNARTTA